MRPVRTKGAPRARPAPQGVLFEPVPKPAGARALGRLPQGHMNKTEARYLAEVLEPGRHAGDVQWYGFEAIKYRLADNTFYTPDFAVLLADGRLQAHEIKGRWEDDARVKIKVAASLFPIQFIAVKAPPKKGEPWQFEEF